MDSLEFHYLAHLLCAAGSAGMIVRKGWLRAGVIAFILGLWLLQGTSPAGWWVLAGLIINALFIAKRLIHLSPTALMLRKSIKVEQFLAKTALKGLSPEDARTFYEFAREGSLPAGARMIHAGTHFQHLFFIVKGKASVYAQGKKVAELEAGRFVGEMSLLTRSRTRADVDAETDLTLLVWNHEAIRHWASEGSSRMELLQSALGAQVVEVLTRHQSHVRPTEAS